MSAGWARFATSVNDFLQAIAPAFDREYLEHLCTKCEEFDHIVGGSTISNSATSTARSSTTTLADDFIGYRTIGEWIQYICQVIAARCYQRIAEPIPPLDSSVGGVDLPTPTVQAGTVDGGGHCVQIDLVGPSLSEAWRRLDFTRNLEESCPHSNNWPLSLHGTAYVYHGTAAHLAGPGASWIADLAGPTPALCGQSNGNRITRASPSLPLVWTAFSPFRAFLWAVFQADVIGDVPGPASQEPLSSSWKCRGREYGGVLVLQFTSTQPAPSGCSSYVIPPGQELQWSQIALGDQKPESRESPANIWARLSSIHHQPAGSDWPEIIHSLELPASREVLRPLTDQFWRTAWYGRGIEALNSRHERTFAIRYTLVPDPTPPPEQGQETSEDRGHGCWNKETTDVAPMTDFHCRAACCPIFGPTVKSYGHRPRKRNVLGQKLRKFSIEKALRIGPERRSRSPANLDKQ